MCNSEESQKTSGVEAVGPLTMGIHHLGLTVPDVAETAAFFIEHLNFNKLGEQADYPAVFVGDGSIMITLWQAAKPVEAVSFDRHQNVGLHHFALKVANKGALDRLFRQLDTVDGVSFEFGPEPLGDTPLMHMMCCVPGGVRVEFLASP